MKRSANRGRADPRKSMCSMPSASITDCVCIAAFASTFAHSMHSNGVVTSTTRRQVAVDSCKTFPLCNRGSLGHNPKRHGPTSHQKEEGGPWTSIARKRDPIPPQRRVRGISHGGNIACGLEARSSQSGSNFDTARRPVRQRRTCADNRRLGLGRLVRADCPDRDGYVMAPVRTSAT